MMIKEPENYENMKVNVYLKSGNNFIGKDIPPRPTGESEKYISFWDNGRLLIYPLSQVDYFEYTFDF